MPDTGWIFLYTPIPYLAAMYLIAYRHDLVRVARPFHDLSSRWEWYVVCKRLGLTSADMAAPEKPPLGGTRNIILLFASLSIYAVSGFASLVLVWYFLCGIQALVAVPLFVLLVTNRTGPFPSKPYRDVLPYPRLGTRIRALDSEREPKREPSKTSAPSTAGGKS